MSSSPVNLRTLVLSNSYMPLSVFPLSTVSATDAIVGYLSGKVNCVYWYDRPILTPSRTDLRWPSVIVTKHAKKFHNQVKFGKDSLYYRDGGKCFWCDEELSLNNKSMTIDHLVPKSQGGELKWENAVASCRQCNTMKSNHPPTGKWKPKKKVFEPTFFQMLEIRSKFPLVVDDESWIQFLPNFTDNIIVKNKKPELKLVA